MPVCVQMQLTVDALWRGSGSLPAGLDDFSLWKDSGSLPQGLLPGPDVKSILEGFRSEVWLQEPAHGDSSNCAAAQVDDTPQLIVTSGTPSECAAEAPTDTCGTSASKALVARGKLLQASAHPAPSAATSDSNGQGSDKDDTEMMHTDNEDAAGSARNTPQGAWEARGKASRSSANASATLTPRSAAAGVKKAGAKRSRRTSAPKSHAYVQQCYRERQKAKTMELQEAREQLQDQAQQVDAVRAQSAALKVRGTVPHACSSPSHRDTLHR